MKTPNLFLATLIVLLLLGGAVAGAQNFSGLQGQKLRKTEDSGNVLTDLVRKLGGGLTGEILDITVIRDDSKALTLEIEYEGFEDARMTIAVQNKRKKNQGRLVSEQSFSLKGKRSPLKVTLTLKESAPEGITAESAYLELNLSSSSSDPVARLTKKFAKRTALYHLDKKWEKKKKQEKVTVSVTLEPIGSAANLRADKQALTPPTKKPQFKNSIAIKKAILKKRKAARAKAHVASKTTPANTIDGMWLNTNSKTRGITKIIISNNGKKIRVYGKCIPKNCDWGVQKLVASKKPKAYTATFKTSSSTNSLTLDFAKGLKVARRLHKKGYQPLKSVSTFKKWSWKQTFGKRIANTNSGTAPQGPDNKPISLWDNLVTDHNFEFPYEITNVNMNIYPDKNPKSGVFYYQPYAYHLQWNADEGYEFRMLYGTADDVSSGKVRMSGTLTPGIGSAEIALVKTLLRSYVQGNLNHTYKELKVIPLKAKPEISLASGLEGQYNIPPESVDVGVQSGINAPIEVSWVTDSRTKEEMQAALSEGVGIQGLMTLVPDSETVPEQPIPVRINPVDTRTLGRLVLQPNQWRKEEWVNSFPYPIKLNHIHALVIHKQGNRLAPIIYSYALGNEKVSPGDKVKFNADKMPEWLERTGKVESLWLDYRIVDCEPCIDGVMDKLTGGTSGSKVKSITFETFRIFEKLNAALLRIKVRAKQADPKGNTLVELPAIRIDKDNLTYSAGPLYLPENATAEYEYFFTLVTSDGVSYNSDRWQSSRELEMFIGVQTLKDAISDLN